MRSFAISPIFISIFCTGRNAPYCLCGPFKWSCDHRLSIRILILLRLESHFAPPIAYQTNNLLHVQLMSFPSISCRRATIRIAHERERIFGVLCDRQSKIKCCSLISVDVCECAIPPCDSISAVLGSGGALCYETRLIYDGDGSYILPELNASYWWYEWMVEGVDACGEKEWEWLCCWLLLLKWWLFLGTRYCVLLFVASKWKTIEWKFGEDAQARCGADTFIAGAPYWRKKRALNMSNEETASNTPYFGVSGPFLPDRLWLVFSLTCSLHTQRKALKVQNPLSAVLAVVVECRNNKNNNCTENHKADGMGFLSCFSFSFSHSRMRVVNAAASDARASAGKPVT